MKNYNSPRPIQSEFGLTILDWLSNKKMTVSEAYYVLLKWFDTMNVDEPDKDVDINKFIYAYAKEYHNMMLDKLEEAFCLVDLLFETDREKRNKIIDELEKIK